MAIKSLIKTIQDSMPSFKIIYELFTTHWQVASVYFWEIGQFFFGR